MVGFRSSSIDGFASNSSRRFGRCFLLGGGSFEGSGSKPHDFLCAGVKLATPPIFFAVFFVGLFVFAAWLLAPILVVVAVVVVAMVYNK